MDNEQMDLTKELRDITKNLITRVKDGCSSLSVLEKKLLTMLNDDDNIKNNPHFLLQVCKYFRGSIDSEVAAVWDLALKIAQKKIDEGDGSKLNSFDEELINSSPSVRESMRKKLRLEE